MKYIVHLREKRNGKVEVEAESSMDAMSNVKRLIRMDGLPAGAMEKESVIVVKFASEV